MGIFTITSTGEVLSHGKTVARCRFVADVKMFSAHHLTSQADFENACVKTESQGYITGPFAQSRLHAKIGNIMISSFSEPDGYTVSFPPEQPPTSGGGGGEIVLSETGQPFRFVCAVDGEGYLCGNPDIRWQSTASLGTIVSHVHYQRASNTLRCTSLLVAGNEAGESKQSRLMFYKTKVRRDWRDGMLAMLKDLYAQCGLYYLENYLSIADPHDPPESGDRKIELLETILSGDLTEENLYRIYMAFARASIDSLGAPLWAIIRYRVLIYNGDNWVQQSTVQEINFNALEYLRTINFACPYGELASGLFCSVPTAVDNDRTTSYTIGGQVYQEGIHSGQPFLHDFDRARWEKTMKGPFAPISYMQFTITPSANLEPQIEVMCIKFGGVGEQLEIETHAENIEDDEQHMGGTLNCWYGSTDISSGTSGKGIFQPQARSSATYTGEVMPAVSGAPWWQLGTLRWTGYTPLENTSLQVNCNNKNVDQDGTWAENFARPLHAPGDRIKFSVQLNQSGRNLPMLTPFLEDVTLLTIVPPQYYSFLQYWD